LPLSGPPKNTTKIIWSKTPAATLAILLDLKVI